MNSDNIALRKTQHNNAEEDCFKILILREALKTQHQHQVDSYAFSEVKHLCQSVGCARKRPQSHTAQQKLRLFLWMQVYECDPWYLAGELFHSSPNQINKSKDQESQGNLSRNTTLHMKNQNPTEHVNLDPKNVDHVSTKVRSFQCGSMLYVLEDNEAVIKMIMKGRSPTMRHVSRTHRVAVDWLFDRINLDPKIQIWYIDTKHQLADILTKGNFARDEWNIFSSFVQHHLFQLYLLRSEFQFD